MADETDLACAADTAERDALLSLLQKHLTLSIEKEGMSDGGVYVTIKLDFDGEPVATDWFTI